MNCVYAYNKIDGVSLEEVNRLAHQPHTVPISCEIDLNLDYLIERMWEQLDLLKIYTKRRGVSLALLKVLLTHPRHTPISMTLSVCARARLSSTSATPSTARSPSRSNTPSSGASHPNSTPSPKKYPSRTESRMRMW